MDETKDLNFQNTKVNCMQHTRDKMELIFTTAQPHRNARGFWIIRYDPAYFRLRFSVSACA